MQQDKPTLEALAALMKSITPTLDKLDPLETNVVYWFWHLALIKIGETSSYAFSIGGLEGDAYWDSKGKFSMEENNMSNSLLARYGKNANDWSASAQEYWKKFFAANPEFNYRNLPESLEGATVVGLATFCRFLSPHLRSAVRWFVEMCLTILVWEPLAQKENYLSLVSVLFCLGRVVTMKRSTYVTTTTAVCFVLPCSTFSLLFWVLFSHSFSVGRLHFNVGGQLLGANRKNWCGQSSYDVDWGDRSVIPEVQRTTISGTDQD